MSLSGRRIDVFAAGLLLATLAATGCVQKTSDAVNAQWSLMDSSAVTSKSTSLDLGVMRIACGSGVTGGITGAQVDYGEENITIGMVVEPLTGAPQTCQSNETVPYTLELEEPVGQRTLIDASCAAADTPLDETGGCGQEGIRWAP
ncbi:hypothetical protein [Glutamicibacter halophytocola]|uniref:Lipoprotein n=1 Tax=Glutamicibacter halophytocola TaxID=1933880 RepID=A0AA94XV58_9MICC|nr:hypothetical protein [Glutamicibacter halophytocola]UUX60540.1 hypothetical protein NUH22_08050 [Glutamicibacter halophytocola]